MNLERCASIIKQNKIKKQMLEDYLQIFYAKCGLNHGEPLTFDSWGVVKLVAEKLKTLSLFIPMKNDEMGALCYYHKIGCSYVFVNSSIPEANMRYAYCHELYHLLKPSELIINNGMDMYLDTEYADSDDEMMANSFAGALLMPEARFKSQFCMVNNESIDITETVVKLADFFGAPYVSVVIRCYELDMIKDIEKLPELLSVTKETLFRLYEEYWLNNNMLVPNKINQFNNLKSLLEKMSDSLVEDEVLTHLEKEYILDKVNTLYNKIKA